MNLGSKRKSNGINLNTRYCYPSVHAALSSSTVYYTCCLVCWNQNLRGLHVGAMEGLFCHILLRIQTFCIPPSLLIRQLEALRKKYMKELLSINCSSVWIAFYFLASLPMSRCMLCLHKAEVPSQRFGSFYLSVQMVTIKQWMFLNYTFKAALNIPTLFGSVKNISMISGSSKST